MKDQFYLDLSYSHSILHDNMCYGVQLSITIQENVILMPCFLSEKKQLVIRQAIKSHGLDIKFLQANRESVQRLWECVFYHLCGVLCSK